MAWLTANWFPVVIFVAFVAMHVFGHGGHGGHGRHNAGTPAPRGEDSEQRDPLARGTEPQSGGHQH